MAKRIFKIMGIVFGAVLGFVGIVAGVLAAMGKFKTPVVFPSELIFLENDIVVIEGKTFNPNEDWETQFSDETNLPSINFFVLSGVSSNKEYDVNRKDCYISFYKNVGADLITLCDENGRPLVANENNYYLVQCNEPIYYMINEIAEDATTEGKVQLTAKSTNNKVMVQEPLTFWIDREVQGVFVDTTLEDDHIPSRDPNLQNITVGVGIGFDIKYEVDTPLSLKPIAKESEKEIELYYVATGYSTDYLKVTEEEVNNVSSPLNKILTCEDGVFRFEADVAGEYEFLIAVFPTYQSKIDYLASIEGLTLDNPNFHRVESMKETLLNIVVENSDVSEIGLMGTNVVLNLYSQKDYITLDGETGIDGAKDNNLELFMKRGTGANVVTDYARFDEVSMNGFVFAEKNPMFIAHSDDGEREWTYNLATGLGTMLCELSHVKLSDDLTIINFMYQSSDVAKDNKYYCRNGVAVWDSSDDTIKILKEGSYLNFFVQDGTGALKIKNFNYEANVVKNSQGRTKSWQIITKEIPALNDANNESLKLGILVVNKNSEFVLNNFFATIPVSINEVALDCDILNENVNLDIEFLDATNVDLGELRFENMVSVNAASYSACVLVVEEKAAYNFDVISTIKFSIDGKTYVLVGYEKDERFVNAVRTNETVSKTNKQSEIFVLQLKNKFDEDVNDIIDPILADIRNNVITDVNIDIEDSNTIINKLVTNDTVTINSKYLLNKNLISVEFYDSYDEDTETGVTTRTLEENYTVFENTDNHVIVFKSSNLQMLKKVVDYYEINATFFEIDFDLNVEIYDTKMSGDEEDFIVYYNAKKCLSDEKTPISIKLTVGSVQIDLPKLLILNGSPDEIVLNAGEGNSVILADSVEKAEISENYLKVAVGYDGAKYTYSFNLNGTYTIDGATNIFNTVITSSDAIGFQDKSNKGQSLNVLYDSSNKMIFNAENLFDEHLNLKMENLVEKSGNTTLLVTIGETTAYLKLVVSTSSFSMTTAGEETSFDKEYQNFDINDERFGPGNNERLVSLKYNGTADIDLTKNNLAYIDNVKCVAYGDGTLTCSGNKIDGWELKKGATVILSIKDEGDGWKFAKSNEFVSLTISFDVTTIAGTVSIVYTFSSSVEVSVNPKWSDHRVFYAGTSVLLFSKDAGTESVFKSVNDIDVLVENSNDFISTNQFEVPESYIGNISIQIYLGGEKILEFVDFVVKANVLDSIIQVDKVIDTPDGPETIKVDKTFKSEISYSVEEVYDFKYYDDTIIYGSSEDELYTTPTNPSDLTPKHLKNIDDYGKLSIVPDAEFNSNPELNWGSNKLNIGAMLELRTQKIRRISLMYQRGISDYVEVSTREITIENVNELTLDDVEVPIYDNVVLIKALKKYSTSFATVSGFDLQTMTADGIEFEVFDVENMFKVKTTLTQAFEDVDVLLTFSNGTQTLTYSIKFDILPYSPEEKIFEDRAYSGTNYDLFNGIYDIATIESDNNIKSLIVTAILDDDGNDITSEIIKGSFTPSGYTRGEAGANCEIEFNESKEKFYEITDTIIQFEIKYNNDLTYTYQYYLAIFNRQSILIDYPESDLKVENQTFKFLPGYEEIGALLTANDTNAEGIYQNKNNHNNYEPIMVFTDSSQIVNFKEDPVKKISRAVVINNTMNTNNSTSSDLKITLIGYENGPGMAEYASRINTNYDTNQIGLPVAIQGMSGILVFRLETVSGCSGYYFVYVYCVGSSVKINEEHNLKVAGYQGTIGLEEYTATDVVSLDITGKTYKQLVNELSGESDLYGDGENVTFLKLFGRSYNEHTTSIYLYEGIAVGGTFNYDIGGDFNSEKWNRVDDYGVTLNEKFNTITIGLFYNSSVERYIYGTITIYVQPTTSVTATDVNYIVPNGTFEKIVDANATRIESPFGTSWSATIVEVNGNHANYSTLGSDVEIDKRVAQDEFIKVQYENGGTIAYVTYTYKATILPDDVQKSITVGKFDPNAKLFINTIDLKTEQFFGTYNDNYVVDFDKMGIAERVGDTIKFRQTHEQQIVKATITYTNYEDGTTTRSFTFVVCAGIDYIEDTRTNTSGLSTSRRARTISKDDYTASTGSQLKVEYAVVNSLHSFKIAGLTIFTNEPSVLSLTFDKLSYVLSGNNILDEEGVRSISVNNLTPEQMINFVHSAKDENLTMTVSILKEGGMAQYDTRNLYLTVVQTYTRLDAKYLVTGADHENVKNEHQILDLHTTLLNTNNRIQLLGTTYNNATKSYEPISGANLLGMGFATYGNPNFIKFSVGGNAIIKNDSDDGSKDINDLINDVKIEFKKVTRNTECVVYLNNQAGMEANSVWYNYQIMAMNAVDGLNYNAPNDFEYKATTGIEGIKSGNKYVSYLMKAEKENDDYFQKFYIGKMLDERNLTIFNLTVNGESYININYIYIEDEKSNKIGGYFDAIQYEYDTFYITYDRQTGYVELIMKNNIASTQEEIVISVSGVNGGTTIVENLILVFTNYQISGKFADRVDTSIYAGDIIYLKDKINGHTANITYTLQAGEYSISGEANTRYIDKEENDNDLFKFDGEKLEIKAVGTLVRTSLVFLAQMNNYALKEIEYNFNVNLNMQFVVNGETLADNVGNTSPETNFVLTNDRSLDKDATQGFPVEIKFISKSDFNDDAKYKSSYNYFNSLVFDLYKLNIQGNLEAVESDKIMSRYNTFTVEIHSNIENGIMKIDKDGNGDYVLKFLKDYTGDVELKLSVKTDNGTYYVIWTIHVYGIKTITHTSANHEYARIQNNALPFDSGTTVGLIDRENKLGVGLVMEDSPAFASTSQITKKIYEYKINTFNATTSAMTNKELFDVADDFEYLQGKGNGFIEDDENVMNVILPNVPSADDGQSYLITFRVYVEYKDFGLAYDPTEIDDNKQKVKVFYASYEVLNRQKVKAYPTTLDKASSDVLVDGADKNITNDNKLYLFYFDETYSANGTEYKFAYTDTLGFEMNDGVKAYTYDYANKCFINGSDKYYYVIKEDGNHELYKNGLSETDKISGGTWTRTTRYENNKLYGVFESNFLSIFDYKTFIDAFVNKTKDVDNSYVKLGNEDFTLIPMEADDGCDVFGINLEEKFNGANKFNNELVVEFNMVENGVNTITIPAYSEINKTGFRLTTSDKIEAKTNGGLGVKLSTMFLPKYFESTADGIAEGVTLNTSIIGVGAPDADWTNKGSYDASDNKAYAIIKIPNGGTDANPDNNYNIYKVKKVTYESTSGTLYNLKETFYYLTDGSNSTEYIVPDYNAVGIESTFYKLTYMPHEEYQSLDLTKAFKVWCMNSGNMDYKPASTYSLVVIDQAKVEDFISVDSTIKIKTAELDDYKKANPNKKNYPTAKATINANGYNFYCEIVFALPEYVHFEVGQATTDIDLLAQGLKVPKGTGFENLTSAEQIKYLDEMSAGRYISSYDSLHGKIIFNTAKIAQYFVDNAAEDYLNITCRITTQEDKTFDFQIVVAKT